MPNLNYFWSVCETVQCDCDPHRKTAKNSPARKWIQIHLCLEMIMITFAKAGEEDPKAPEVRYILKGKNFKPLPWLGVKIQLGNHMAPIPLHSHMGSPMLGM